MPDAVLEASQQVWSYVEMHFPRCSGQWVWPGECVPGHWHVTLFFYPSGQFLCVW